MTFSWSAVLAIMRLDLSHKHVHNLRCVSCAGKWGSVTTVSLMIVGAIFLTANGAGLDGRGFTIMYIVSQV